MRDGFEYYRAFPVDVEQNKALVNQSKLHIPVLVLEADFYPVFGGAVQGIPVVDAIKTMAQNVTGIKVPLSGHWIPEEQPNFLLKQLANFFGGNSTTSSG
jgi:pimeloyl-ACP methyl ester carboxylesterase